MKVSFTFIIGVHWCYIWEWTHKYRSVMFWVHWLKHLRMDTQIMSNDGLCKSTTWPAPYKNIQVLIRITYQGTYKFRLTMFHTFGILYWCESLFVLFFKDGRSALMLASENGHTDTVKCLIDAKAQLDLQTNASIIYHVARYIYSDFEP